MSSPLRPGTTREQIERARRDERVELSGFPPPVLTSSDHHERKPSPEESPVGGKLHKSISPLWALIAIALALVGAGVWLANVQREYVKTARVDLIDGKDGALAQADRKSVQLEREIYVLKQAFDDLKETNREIRDTLRGYNAEAAKRQVPTPFPVQRK